MANIILIILIFVGFGLIIFSVFKKEESVKIDIDEAKTAQNDLFNTISDADGAIEELNKLCNDAFEEFEEKYQELLFLYQMIEEKKKTSSLDIKVENKPDESTNKRTNKTKKSNYSNPRLKDIQKLQKQGLSVAEIAKKLNMGQGEVKLIAELGKER